MGGCPDRSSTGARRVASAAILLATALVVGGVGAGTSVGQDAGGVATSDGRFVPGEVIVRYEPRTSERTRGDLVERVGAEVERDLLLPRAELLDLDRGVTVDEAVAELRSDPDVAYAEPNYLLELEAVPDDANFGTQYALNNTGQMVNGTTGTADADIDAVEAWDMMSGSPNVVVAILDSGIAIDHPDLAANAWANPGETQNGLDDDANGRVDDINGFDFVDNDSDPTDLNSHGTHVAGIAAAVGNNSIGISGVTQNADLMAVRVCAILGGCPAANIADGFLYAADEGADVVNGSFGSPSFVNAVNDAIAARPNTQYVFASGNGGADNIGDDLDATPQYPCDYDQANIICVGSSDNDDQPAASSNFGQTSVDLFAPGVNVLATDPYDRVFSPDFESGFQGFVAAPPGSWGLEDIDPGPGTDRALSDSPGGDYGNNENDSVISPQRNLAGRSNCSVAFNASIATEAGADFLIVETSTDGTNWTQVSSRSGTIARRDFLDQTPLLDGSSTAQFRFRLVTNGANTAAGVWITEAQLRCRSLDYRFKSGTSMASPAVAGAAALLLGAAPSLTVAQLRTAILSTVDTPAALNNLSASDGRLNLERAVRSVATPETTITSGPSGSTNGVTNDNTPSFTFTSTADPNATYECGVDEEVLAACSGPGASHTTGTLADGHHTFAVRSTSTASGRTDPSPALRGFDVDTQPPQVTIDSGPPEPTNDTTPTFTFSSNEDPDVDYLCGVDTPTPTESCSGPGQSHTTAELSPGPHTFYVTGTDEATNSATASRAFTIDTAAPSTTIDSGPDDPTNDDTPSFTFSADEAGATFACSIDGEPFLPCNQPPNAHTAAALPDGSHTFAVQATDAAGNTGPPASLAFTVDTIPPQTVLTNTPGGRTTDRTPRFDFKTIDASAVTTDCRLDSGGAEPCSSPLVLGPLGAGDYRLRVLAVDAAGNVEVDPAERRFEVVVGGAGEVDDSFGTGGSLPFTGLLVGALALIGAGLLVSGGGLQRAAGIFRRRGDTAEPPPSGLQSPGRPRHPEGAWLEPELGPHGELPDYFVAACLLRARRELGDGMTRAAYGRWRERTAAGHVGGRSPASAAVLTARFGGWGEALEAAADAGEHPDATRRLVRFLAAERG